MPGGIISITVTELERPAHSGWHHSLIGILDCRNGKQTKQQYIKSLSVAIIKYDDQKQMKKEFILTDIQRECP